MKIAYNPTTAAALTTAPNNNDITFDLKGLNIFTRGIKFKGTDTTYSVFKNILLVEVEVITDWCLSLHILQQMLDF